MRLTVNILHIARLERLIEDNELFGRALKPDAHGGWYIDATKMQLAEIERQLKKNNIKYIIK